MKIPFMSDKILSIDKIFMRQNHPWMERFSSWMEKFHPWIKKLSMEKNSGRSFYPWRSSMDMTDETHGRSLTLQSTE